LDKKRLVTPAKAQSAAVPDPPLSEYEKLRQRNIERNNARLAALGLMNPSDTLSSKRSNNTQKQQRPRKRPAVDPQRQEPSRRSTRHRTAVGSDANQVKKPLTLNLDTFPEDQDGSLRSPSKDSQETIYTHSPLFFYDMDKKSGVKQQLFEDQSTTASSNGLANMTSLQMAGPRYFPPKGLTSIYSLEFWNQDWLVGAGKSGMVAVWNVSHAAKVDEDALNDTDPIMAWKGHNGRWIADAKFLRTVGESKSSPQTLITAGNDGTVCIWDLQNVSSSSGVPKLIDRTGKELHTSGIFCMDVANSTSTDTMVCTGSKDKTVALFNVDSHSYAKHKRVPFWISDFHSAKVGAVQLKGKGTTILASASDDGRVAIQDYRMDGAANGSVVAQVEAHQRPHSAVWDPNDDNILATAGLDSLIKLWDWRHLQKPLATLQGHVPVDIKCRRIHRPVFVPWSSNASKTPNKSLLLSGGQGSGSLSTFEIVKNTSSSNSMETCLFSRGELPADCGDAGCIAVQDRLVAVSVQQGEVLLLRPSKQ
jgi:WD40 repeat protein